MTLVLKNLETPSIEDVRHIHMPELAFLVRKSEEPSQIEVTREEVLKRIDKSKINKSLAPAKLLAQA